jgi:hypothetical protein
MKHIRFWLLMIGLGLLAAVPAAGQGKSGKGGGGGGGETEDNSGHAPVTFTLRDCRDGSAGAAFAGLHPEEPLHELCAATPDDRIRSDSGLPYVGGVDGVDAYVGTKGTAGNFWLKVAPSPRTLYLDFTDCKSPAAECKPPFDAAEVDRAALYVQISAVRKNGAFGMAVGETLLAPMRIYVEPVAGQMNFVDFNPNLSGKDPCKNRSNYIEVTRTSATTWEVYGDAIGCMSDHNGFGGTYRMPFRLTVERQ